MFLNIPKLEHHRVLWPDGGARAHGCVFQDAKKKKKTKKLLMSSGLAFALLTPQAGRRSAHHLEHSKAGLWAWLGGCSGFHKKSLSTAGRC